MTSVTATDADALDVLRFAITGGADAARFAIDPVSGALSFVAAPNHEAPADANADNRYEVTVTVSDGALSAQQALFIDVGNVDEAPTIVTNVLLLSKDGATIVLLGTDPDTAASALNYQASGQVGGRFELVAAPGVAVTGFSQAQVDAGAVRFVADGSGAGPTYVLQPERRCLDRDLGRPARGDSGRGAGCSSPGGAGWLRRPTLHLPRRRRQQRLPLPQRPRRRLRWCRPRRARFRRRCSLNPETTRSSRVARHRTASRSLRPPHRQQRAIPP